MNQTLKDSIRKDFEEKWSISDWGFSDEEDWKFISERIDRCVEEKDKIDHSIDVRYESNLETAFNNFIKKWCGSYYGHLPDI